MFWNRRGPRLNGTDRLYPIAIDSYDVKTVKHCENEGVYLWGKVYGHPKIANGYECIVGPITKICIEDQTFEAEGLGWKLLNMDSFKDEPAHKAPEDAARFIFELMRNSFDYHTPPIPPADFMANRV
jgi:hypothetical protein